MSKGKYENAPHLGRKNDDRNAYYGGGTHSHDRQVDGAYHEGRNRIAGEVETSYQKGACQETNL